jgi:hypothetical protein
MFDPERDDPTGDGAFWRRVGVVVLVTALAAFAMWPSISGFAAGTNTSRACVALRDGWHVDRTVSDSRLNSGAGDPAAVSADLEWRDGAGACVPEARHRLMLSGAGLAVLIGGVAAAVVALRRRTRNGRPEGRPEIAVPVGA